MKNDKPIDFFRLSLNFLVFIFKIFKKKSNQLIFSEPIKPIRISFHRYYNP
jgi:hypothetical protein